MVYSKLNSNLSRSMFDKNSNFKNHTSNFYKFEILYITLEIELGNTRAICSNKLNLPFYQR